MRSGAPGVRYRRRAGPTRRRTHRWRRALRLVHRHGADRLAVLRDHQRARTLAGRPSRVDIAVIAKSVTEQVRELGDVRGGRLAQSQLWIGGPRRRDAPPASAHARSARRSCRMSGRSSRPGERTVAARPSAAAHSRASTERQGGLQQRPADAAAPGVGIDHPSELEMRRPEAVDPQESEQPPVAPTTTGRGPRSSGRCAALPTRASADRRRRQATRRSRSAIASSAVVPSPVACSIIAGESVAVRGASASCFRSLLDHQRPLPGLRQPQRQHSPARQGSAQPPTSGQDARHQRASQHRVSSLASMCVKLQQ